MPDLSKTGSGRAPWLACISLIVLGLLAFWPTVGFEFVNWDDPAYVWHNDLIKNWSPATLYGVMTETVTRNYAPLTIGTLLIDHTLWGMNAGGYHATNLLLHLTNGLLVFFLTRQLTGNRFVGWLTAALFLVHPVQIETVAWISSRKGLLSAAFMLGALIVRLRPETDAKNDLWYIVLLSAALMSKALAVVIPPIVLLYDISVLRHRFSDALVRQVIPGLISLLLLLKTMASQHTVMGGLRGHMDLNLLEIIAVDAVILWRYIGMLIFPVDLCVLYDPPTSGIADLAIACGIGWTAVAITVWILRDRLPLLAWSAGTFLLLLLPVLNFFRITTLMNDRYLYLPCIVFFALVATGSQQLLDRLTDGEPFPIPALGRITKWSAGLAMVTAALVATTQHLPVWQNSFTLWNHAMQHVPQLPAVRMQFALTHYDSGQKAEAVRILHRALQECHPDEADLNRMQKAADKWAEEIQTIVGSASPQHRVSDRRNGSRG